MTYRPDNHWGVTIVRKGCDTAPGITWGEPDVLIAVVVNPIPGLTREQTASRICDLLDADDEAARAELDATIARLPKDSRPGPPTGRPVRPAADAPAGEALMAMWFDLRVGTEHVGGIEIRRQEPFDLTDPAINEQWFTYNVRRDGRLVGQVRHVYGHGAWRLLELVSSLLAEDDWVQREAA